MLLLFSCVKKESPYDVCQTYPFDFDFVGLFPAKIACEKYKSLMKDSAAEQLVSEFINSGHNFFLIKISNTSANDNLIMVWERGSKAFMSIDYFPFKTNSKGYLQPCDASLKCGNFGGFDTILPGKANYKLISDVNIRDDSMDYYLFSLSRYLRSPYIDSINIINNQNNHNSKNNQFFLLSPEHPFFLFKKEDTNFIKADLYLFGEEQIKTQKFYLKHPKEYYEDLPCKDEESY